MMLPVIPDTNLGKPTGAISDIVSYVITNHGINAPSLRQRM